MQITKMSLPASLPELAWVSESVLKINYHRYGKTQCDYTDDFAQFPLETIGLAVMVYGKRKGFKYIKILGRGKQEVFRISKNHKKLVVQLYNLLHKNGVPTIKEI